MKDNHTKSFLKGVTWRVIGTMDTIFLSWLFTGQIETALKIGGIEIFTKIILFYFHERIWLKIPFARKIVDNGNGQLIKKDRHRRGVIKGISWRIFGTLDTMTIAFFVTGDYKKALSIGFTEVFTKVFLYYLHEQVWNRIQFGSTPEVVAIVNREMGR